LRVKVLIEGKSEQFEISTRKYFADKKEWNNKTKSLKGNSESVRRLMKKIKEFEATIEDVWEREKEYEQITVQYFRSEIYNALETV